MDSHLVKATKEVEKLIERSSTALPTEAMQLSQAAQNAAHALATMQDIWCRLADRDRTHGLTRWTDLKAKAEII